MDSLAASRLPDIVTTYHQHYRQVYLLLQIGPSGSIFQKLLNGQLASALVDAQQENQQCHSRADCRDQLVLISSLSFTNQITPSATASS